MVSNIVNTFSVCEVGSSGLDVFVLSGPRKGWPRTSTCLAVVASTLYSLVKLGATLGNCSTATGSAQAFKERARSLCDALFQTTLIPIPSLTPQPIRSIHAALLQAGARQTQVWWIKSPSWEGGAFTRQRNNHKPHIHPLPSQAAHTLGWRTMSGYYPANCFSPPQTSGIDKSQEDVFFTKPIE